MLHFHVFSRFPEPLQLPITTPSFSQGIKNCSVDPKHLCWRFWHPVGNGDLFLFPPEPSYRSEQTTNSSSAALPMAMAISSLSSSEGRQQNLWGPTAKAGVSSLSLVINLFYQNGWSQGCGLGLIFEFPGFCQWVCHKGDVICPAALIATWRFCCCSWRFIRKNCLQNVVWLLHVHPCSTLCLCLWWCSQSPSHRRREHKDCSWREGRFPPHAVSLH